MIVSTIIGAYDDQRPVFTTITNPKEITASPDDEKKLRPFTTNLPSVDQIKIESIKDDGTHKSVQVLGSLLLSREKAFEFASLWRSQNYLFGQLHMCHRPGYRITFYTADSPLIETTVCFDCHDVYFRFPQSTSSSLADYGTDFDTDSLQGQKLHTYLANLFPVHDPDANKP